MTGEDWQWAVPGAAWLLTYLIHSTLLIAAVWLVSRRLEGRPAALEALWKTALVGGLVTATLQTAAGVSPWGGRLALDASSSAASIAAASAAEPDRIAGPAAGSAIDDQVARPSPDARAAAEPAAGAQAAAPSVGRVRSRARDEGAAEAVAAAAPESSMAGSSARSAPSSMAAPSTGSVPSSMAAPSASSAPSSMAAPSAGPASTPPSSAPATASLLARSSVPSARPETGSSPLMSPRVLLTLGFLAWAAFAALLATGLIRSWLRLRRLLADRRPIESGPAARLLGALTMVSSLRRRIRLSASTRVDVPIAVGVLRPEIVVPERALYQLDAAELESLLAHELAHLVRRDPLWRVLAGCFHRILFVQPLNRVATAHLESASEVLCDDWAVERTDHPLALARCLTEVAGWVTTPLGASVPAMARNGSGLGRRVRRLVAAGDGASPRRRDRWPVPFACGALALVVFAAPGAGETGGSSPLASMPPRAVAPVSTEQAAHSAAPLAPLDRKARREPAAAQDASAANPARSASPSVDKMAEARRLLAELRSGSASQHDIADWVALAQVLGSGHGGARALLASSGDPDGSAGGRSLFAGHDLEDALAGALSHALGGLDVGFELDADGSFEIHLGDIDIDRDDDEEDGHDEGDRDEDGFDLDLELPEIEIPEIEIDLGDLEDLDDLQDLHDLHMHAPPPSPPGTPSPPPPPDCGHGFPSEAVHEIQRQALQTAREAQQQARAAIEQGRRAREEALRQAHEARQTARHALRRAAHERAQALAQAGHARAQALRDAERARKHALRDAERAREQALAQAQEAIERAREVRQELRRQAEQRRRERDRDRDRDQL